MESKITDYKAAPFTVAVDFDGTIARLKSGFNHVDQCEPNDGVKQALTQFKEWGWHIIVFTCRNDNEGISLWLNEHAIPFDEINSNGFFSGYDFSGKVVADLYIDDRGLRFKSWDETMNQIGKMFEE